MTARIETPYMASTPVRIARTAILGIVTLAHLGGCADSDSTVTPPAEDDAAPAAVVDLTVTQVTATTAVVEWTASGDDGGIGTATTYDLRFSSEEATSFNEMSKLPTPSMPKPSGSSEQITVDGLVPSQDYYFLLRVGDEVPNWSGESNRTHTSTPCVGDEHWRQLDDYAGEVFAAVTWNGDLLIGVRGGIRRWNGSHWEPFVTLAPSSGDVRSFGTYEGHLVAGGRFTRIGDVPASNIAILDGSTWRSLGAGFPDQGEDDQGPVVLAMLEHDGALIAAGAELTRAGDVQVQNIAQWDGTSWSASGETVGLLPEVNSLAEVDGALIAGTHFGAFTLQSDQWVSLAGMESVSDLTVVQGVPFAAGRTAGGNAIGQWDGSAWMPIAEPAWSSGLHVATHQGELVALVWVGGEGNTATRSLVRWRGGSWERLGCRGNGRGYDYQTLESTPDGLLVSVAGWVRVWAD